MKTAASPQTEQRGAPGTAAVVFVVPAGSLDTRSGTGQRTAILFEAFRKLGEVSVIILAETAFSGGERLFPGARRVIAVASPAMARPPARTSARAAQAIRRLLAPGRTFAAQPGLAGTILDELDAIARSSASQGSRIVAARYARTFALTGLRADPAQGLASCVDVDDRDDQKIDHQIKTRLGPSLGGLASLFWKPRFTRRLSATLSQASVVFLAKEQDRFTGMAAPQIVVPNVPFATPDTAAIIALEETAETLLFVGIASHRPNLAGVTWFLRACWPAIRAARPTATFRIVGLGDWSALPADLTAQPGVQVVGTVEDLAAEYALARAAICPIREGAGSQIKVIEACAFARPVVTTAFASGGFGPAIEAALSVATDAPGFVQACIDLLADPARAARQGATLHQLQQATHSRDAVERLIVTTLTDVMAQSRPLPKVPA